MLFVWTKTVNNRAPAAGGDLYEPVNAVGDPYCTNCANYPVNNGQAVACLDGLCQYPLTAGEIEMRN